MKAAKTVICGIALALLLVALAACGTGAPAIALGDYVAVPIFGEWEADDDSGNAGTSTITMTETTEDGMPAWNFAGMLTRDFVWGGTTFGFSVDEEIGGLLGSATSISFMVRTGAGGQQFLLQLHDQRVTDYGQFAVNFETVEGEATRLSFPIRHFMQPAWAVPVGRLRADNIIRIQWATHDSINPGAYDITIWDISLHVPE